jgi:hypothetical protein
MSQALLAQGGRAMAGRILPPMKTQKPMLLLAHGFLALFLSAGAAHAWHVKGKVLCDENANGLIDAQDHAVANVMIAVENASGAFSAVVKTAADGTFHLEVPHTADNYLVYMHPPTVPPGAATLLPAGGIHAFALTDANQFFEQADFLLDCVPDEVPPPTNVECGKVTGGGWILRAPSGVKATFGVSGGLLGDGFWGHINYVDHGTGLHVRSTAVTAFNDDPADENGRIIHYNVLIGTNPGTAVVRVVDNGEPGARDLFEITLSNGYTAKGELGNGRPGGGNIQLHKCPPGAGKKAK